MDIDGHRNEAGGYDHDMYELMIHFIPEMLLPYLTEISSPLLRLRNPDPQRSDIPPDLSISSNPVEGD
jgi:hypothetical protein